MVKPNKIDTFCIISCKGKNLFLSLRHICRLFSKNMISKSQQKYIKQLEQKKYRLQEKAFVAEGPKVVGGFLQHPQQVLAVFAIPHPTAERLSTEKLYLALDGIQDPGNLGTIIRIADWFGIDTIFCSYDTADAWNPKVVQATMGSISRVNIVYTSLQQIIAESSMPVYGTLLDGQNIYAQDLSKGGIIVMGNEGNGISEPIRALISHRLFIPSYPAGSDTAESLNVAIATAITCAEFRRRG